MKSRILPIVFTLFLILSLGSSCERGFVCTRGQGDLVTQSVDLPAITGFRSMGAADIVLTQGEEQSMTITAQQNIIDKLKTDVKDGIWRVDFQGCITRMKDVTIEITLPTLTFASIEGSGNITATNRFTELDQLSLGIEGSGNITLDFDANSAETWITGSGNIDLDLAASTLNTKTTGSGDYSLSGATSEFSHRISGSGNCSAFNLATEYVTVKVSGAGDCRVSANQSLDVDISGSGNVYYKGQPQINVDISGSGSLINAN